MINFGITPKEGYEISTDKLYYASKFVKTNTSWTFIIIVREKIYRELLFPIVSAFSHHNCRSSTAVKPFLLASFVANKTKATCEK